MMQTALPKNKKIYNFFNKTIKIKLWCFFSFIFTLILIGILIKPYLYHYINDGKKAYAYKVISGHLKRPASRINDKSIVFLGSSTVQGLNVAMIDKNAVNLGIGGETLSKLNQRITNYKRLLESKLLVFIAGFNDVCWGGEHAYKEFLKLGKYIEKKDVLLVGLQPSPTTNLCDNLQTKLEIYNEKIHNYCELQTSCKFLNLAQILEEQSKLQNRPLKDYFENDEIHLSKLGYRILEESIRLKIRK